jgi:hypothetical protein
MTAKKFLPFTILLMALLLSACHVVDSSVQAKQAKKLPLFGSLQLKLPHLPARQLTAAQVQATTEALMEKGIPAMKADLSFEPQTEAPIYFLQGNTPAALQNFAYPDAACNWMGVAGQAFDKAGVPVANLVVNLGGTLNGTPVDLLGMTGTTQVYGPMSYEIKISDKVLDSASGLWVQLSTPDGQPVSPKFYLQTYADCTKNLIVMNFNQVDSIKMLTFPVIFNQ